MIEREDPVIVAAHVRASSLIRTVQWAVGIPCVTALLALLIWQGGDYGEFAAAVIILAVVARI